MQIPHKETCKIAVVCAGEAKMPLWGDCSTHSFGPQCKPTTQEERKESAAVCTCLFISNQGRGDGDCGICVVGGGGFLNSQQKLVVESVLPLNQPQTFLLSSSTIMVK